MRVLLVCLACVAARNPLDRHSPLEKDMQMIAAEDPTKPEPVAAKPLTAEQKASMVATEKAQELTMDLKIFAKKTARDKAAKEAKANAAAMDAKEALDAPKAAAKVAKAEPASAPMSHERLARLQEAAERFHHSAEKLNADPAPKPVVHEEPKPVAQPVAVKPSPFEDSVAHVTEFHRKMQAHVDEIRQSAADASANAARKRLRAKTPKAAPKVEAVKVDPNDTDMDVIEAGWNREAASHKQ